VDYYTGIVLVLVADVSVVPQIRHRLHSWVDPVVSLDLHNSENKTTIPLLESSKIDVFDGTLVVRGTASPLSKGQELTIRIAVEFFSLYTVVSYSTREKMQVLVGMGNLFCNQPALCVEKVNDTI
jgi:hypothetical protein